MGTFKKITTTLIRPVVEYAVVVWSLQKKSYIRKLEKIQRIAIKMVPELLSLLYKTRLGKLALPSLNKKKKGDLIALYKNTGVMDKSDRNYLIKMDERR